MQKSIMLPSLIYLFLTFPMILGAVEHAQQIELKKGWNAIYLIVEPRIEDQDISQFLIKDTNSTPIEIISTFSTSSTSTEFIKSEDEPNWKEDGWNTWLRADMKGSFLTNLFNLEAHRAYLVKSSKDYTWNVTGELVNVKKRWNPNSFNFTGFEVGDTGANSISFYNYFKNSLNAQSLMSESIYTMDDGKWVKHSLADTLVEKGKSYWVLCSDSSSFDGAVEINTGNHSGSLEFLDTNTYQSISIRNYFNTPVNVVIELIDNNVPLAIVKKNENFKNILEEVSVQVASFSLQTDENKDIKFAILRTKITDKDKKEGILKVSVQETNQEIFIPISGYGVQ